MPSVVAAYQLGLSPCSMAAPDLPILAVWPPSPYPYSGPAIPETLPALPALHQRHLSRLFKSGRQVSPAAALPSGSVSSEPQT